ncbi:hypothetical protein B9G69_010845 [Bdellovibrio sp. SKB1291214]|uniref:hypothetical protein n=1 Tax=Bdellovibrio sp. SKB1291214 TaxID=1732569 RepID=UPI000B516CCE|nr:hypothetical protein [Bdellovibrio sp. SKB1291214]UYL07541.1 hypothetical protein B9G69_010845 [Bdellovibrio sp. SKB1291214]
MNNIILVFAALLSFSACTKNDQAPEAASISKQEQKALIDSLGPGTQRVGGGDPITVINSNSYIQRGLIFERFDPYSIVLRGLGVAPSVILLGSKGLSNLPLTNMLRLEVNKVGAGGVDRNLGRNFNRGLDVYVIAKADGSGATLLASPTGVAPILPKEYSQLSEMLWFVAVFNGEVMRFVDTGNGECLYLNSPITDKDFRFNKNDRTLTSLNMNGLIPLKAAKATMEIIFFSDGELSSGSSLTFKTSRGTDIYTYYPMIGVSKQQQQFQFDIPVEPGNGGMLERLKFAYSPGLQNSSSAVTFTAAVKGWRLFRNY